MLFHGTFGFTPISVETSSVTTLEDPGDGPAITTIELVTEARVEDITESEFAQIAEATKTGCPVSKALTGPNIVLDAKLVT